MSSPDAPGTVVILGAGPAGLAAGLALARADWSVRALEQANTVGGLARTISRDGFRFDIGGHRWFTKNEALNYFLLDLLKDELILVDRTSSIYFDGKHVDYPLRVRNVLPRIGAATSLGVAGDFLKSRVAHRLTKRPVVSMEDAYVAQFGRTLYELFFRTYSEKLWGEHPTLLSGDWVAQRSRGLSLIRVVREAVGHSDETVESLVERFMYPRLGYGRISERMAEEIAAAGGAVDLGCRVTAVHHESGTISGVTVSDGARERFIGGDAFISSIPMTELIRILQPSADSASVAASRALTYRDLITIHVMLDRPRVTGETWMYVQDPGIIFARLHEPRNWSPALAPEGKTSLVLEIFSDAGDGTWQCSDQELCEVAIQQLAQELHFIQPSNVIDAFAVRSQDAYPRYGLGYRDAVSTIKDHLHSYRNLSIVGRGGTFRYNNTDHAIETGLLAARNLLGQSVDPEAVNRGPEYIEERRVPAQRPGGAQASI